MWPIFPRRKSSCANCATHRPPHPRTGVGATGPAPHGSTSHATAAQTTTMSTAPHPGPSAPGARATGGQQALALAAETALAHYPTFEHVVELIRAHRDVKLLVEVETNMRLVSYRPGRITFQPTGNAPQDLSQRLGAALQRWTGNRWGISLVNEGGADTIAEQRDAAETALRHEVSRHPLVKAVLSAFPKAQITSIRTEADIAAEAGAEALPEVEDEWDPFEED